MYSVSNTILSHFRHLEDVNIVGTPPLPTIKGGGGEFSKFYHKVGLHNFPLNREGLVI